MRRGVGIGLLAGWLLWAWGCSAGVEDGFVGGACLDDGACYFSASCRDGVCVTAQEACENCTGPTQFCTFEGVCMDECDLRQCGAGFRGIDCGACPLATQWCDGDGQCVEDCGDQECGLSPHGLDCGGCQGATDWCDSDGQCVEDCGDRICGLSPHGLDCGDCPDGGDYCSEGGQCLGAELTWVTVPGGVFTMGCAEEDDQCQYHEGPARLVTMPSFLMTQTEITQAQYNEVDRINVYCETCPAAIVLWQEAKDYCAAVGGVLPSEAQWEYAARAGSDGVWPFGGGLDELDRYARYHGNSNDRCATVGTRLPNAWGLYDLLGNTWEWVEDQYHDRYNGAPCDGTAWVDDPDGFVRVLKGGGYLDDAADLRPSNRLRALTGHIASDTGFRCVKAAQ